MRLYPLNYAVFTISRKVNVIRHTTDDEIREMQWAEAWRAGWRAYRPDAQQRYVIFLKWLVTTKTQAIYEGRLNAWPMVDGAELLKEEAVQSQCRTKVWRQKAERENFTLSRWK